MKHIKSLWAKCLRVLLVVGLLGVSPAPVKAAGLLDPVFNNPVVQVVGALIVDGIPQLWGGLGLGDRVGRILGGVVRGAANPISEGLWRLGLPLLSLYSGYKIVHYGVPRLFVMPAEIAELARARNQEALQTALMVAEITRQNQPVLVVGAENSEVKARKLALLASKVKELEELQRKNRDTGI